MSLLGDSLAKALGVKGGARWGALLHPEESLTSSAFQRAVFASKDISGWSELVEKTQRKVSLGTKCLL